MYIYNGVAAYKVRTSTNVVDQTKFYVNVKEKTKFMDKYRSEEHTSELQSHSDLVCRLLLEKKKKKKNNKPKQKQKQ